MNINQEHIYTFMKQYYKPNRIVVAGKYFIFLDAPYLVITKFFCIKNCIVFYYD